MTRGAQAASIEEPDDRELVLLARNGDREAFGRLVRRHQSRVFALGIRYFRNAADADDLVQETFLRAWRALGRFDVDRPLVPWLMRIGANWALTQLETRKRHGDEELDESIQWKGPSPEADVDRTRLYEAVNRAVDALPEEQRVVLHLRITEGLSYREIAEALAWPIGTVMSRLSRARETLRAKVKR